MVTMVTSHHIPHVLSHALETQADHDCTGAVQLTRDRDSRLRLGHAVCLSRALEVLSEWQCHAADGQGWSHVA